MGMLQQAVAVSMYQWACSLSVLQLADAMEVMLLAVLSPIVKCEWSLEPWQQALLTSVGMLC